MNYNERINQKKADLDNWNAHKKELAENFIKKQKIRLYVVNGILLMVKFI